MLNHDDQIAQSIPGFQTICPVLQKPLTPRQSKTIGPFLCDMSPGPDAVSYRLSLTS